MADRLGFEWSDKVLSTSEDVDDIFFDIAPQVKLSPTMVSEFIHSVDQIKYFEHTIIPYLNEIAPDGYQFKSDNGQYGFFPIDNVMVDDETLVEIVIAQEVHECATAIGVRDSDWDIPVIKSIPRIGLKKGKPRIDWEAKVRGLATKKEDILIFILLSTCFFLGCSIQ